MRFLSFVLPFFPPRRPAIAAIFVVVVLAHALRLALGWNVIEAGALIPSKVQSEPWRLLSYALVHRSWPAALGHGIGITIGVTMASRVAGRLAAWTGVLGSTLLAGLWLAWRLEPNTLAMGASPAAFCALAMGIVAWLRLRGELTYHDPVDRVAGIGALILGAAVIAIPLLLHAPARVTHAIGCAVGVALVALPPRTWER